MRELDMKREKKRAKNMARRVKSWHYRGDDCARSDVPQKEEEEVKEEEPEGKVAGTLEFWAGDYME